MIVSMSASGLSGLIGGLLGAAKIVPAAGMAVKASGEQVAEEAKANAPVLSGALRDSIGVDSSGLTAEIGPTVDYASYVEWGTWKDAPQPFMEPAAEAGLDDLAEKLLLVGVAF
jgi:HK97 gp10 family phage protein